MESLFEDQLNKINEKFNEARDRQVGRLFKKLKRELGGDSYLENEISKILNCSTRMEAIILQEELKNKKYYFCDYLLTARRSR